MKSFFNRVNSAFKLIIIIALSAFSVCYLVVALSRIFYPYELEWNEGGVLCHALMARAGHPIYVAPNAGFFPWTYMPFYYYVLAFVSLFTGMHFWVGRALSIIFSLIIAYLIFKIVCRESSSKQGGFVGATLFLAAYGITGFWYDLVRMDSMALALLIGGFYLVRFGAWKGQIAAALLFALAVFSKQNLLVFYPFAIVCAVLDGKRKAVAFVISLILFSLLLFVTFNLYTGWWFLDYTIGAPVSHGLNWAVALRHTSYFLITRLPLFVFSFLFLFTCALLEIFRKRKLERGYSWLIVFFGACLCYLLVESHPGAYRNVVIPVVLFGAILIGLLWCKSGNWQKARGFLGRMILFVILLLQLWLFRYDPFHQVPTVEDRASGNRFMKRLQVIDGDILMYYHPYYPVLAGSPATFHGDAIFDRYARGRRSGLKHAVPLDLVRKVENKEYGAIILDHRAPFLDIRELGDVIDEHYVLTERLFPEGTGIFCPKTGWNVRPDFLYLPKKEWRRGLRRSWPVGEGEKMDFIRIMDQFATNRIEVLSQNEAVQGTVMKGGELRSAVMTGSERIGNEEYRLIYNLPAFGFRTGMIKIPEGSLIRLGIGLWAETADRSRIKPTFTLKVVDPHEGKAKVFFRDTFDRDKIPELHYMRWVEIDAGALAGEKVMLQFTVTSDKQPDPSVDWPIWIDPCIVFPAMDEKSPQAQIKKPNAIIIIGDAVRPDHLPPYGYKRDTAPHIASLASRGTTFLNAYSQAPWTKPAVGSIFTGLYPYQHLALIAVDTPQYEAFPQLASLQSDVPTIAEIFRENGYATAAFITNVHLLKSLGFARGFDYYNQMEEISSVEVMDDVQRWMKSKLDTPLFIFIHLMDTHAPYRAMPPFDALYNEPPPNFPDRPLTKKDRSFFDELNIDHSKMNNLSDFINIYDECITQIDKNIGKLLIALDDWGLSGNTAVIFTADHGEAFSEHGNYFHGWTLYNEILQVPLIFFCPEKFPQGTTVDDIVETRDIFPTLIDILGLTHGGVPEAEIRSRSWKDTLQGGGRDSERMAYSETEVTEEGGPRRLHSALTCVQDRNWKLTIDWRNGQKKLYHLAVGAREVINLAGKNFEEEKRLEKILDKRGNIKLPKRSGVRLPEGGYQFILKKKLKALGYIE